MAGTTILYQGLLFFVRDYYYLSGNTFVGEHFCQGLLLAGTTFSQSLLLPSTTSLRLTSNLPRLCFSRTFLADLKTIPLPPGPASLTPATATAFQRRMETVWSSVAAIVCRTWPFFRAYKTYSVGHGSRNMQKWYTAHAGLKDWMQAQLNRSPYSKGTSLESELIKPIQRILKYSLFVRDATKQIHLSTLDIKGQLDGAMSAVDAVSSEGKVSRSCRCL